jgi:hypothetical protein
MRHGGRAPPIPSDLGTRRRAERGHQRAPRDPTRSLRRTTFATHLTPTLRSVGDSDRVAHGIDPTHPIWSPKGDFHGSTVATTHATGGRAEGRQKRRAAPALGMNRVGDVVRWSRHRHGSRRATPVSVKRSTLQLWSPDAPVRQAAGQTGRLESQDQAALPSIRRPDFFPWDR